MKLLTDICDTRIWLPRHAFLATRLCEALGTTYLIRSTAEQYQSQPKGPWITIVKLRLNPRKDLQMEAVITSDCLVQKWTHTRIGPSSSVSICEGRGTVTSYSPIILSKDWNVVNLLISISAEVIPLCNMVFNSQETKIGQQAEDARESESPTVMAGIGPHRVEWGNLQCKSMQTSSGSTMAKEDEMTFYIFQEMVSL